MLIPPACQGLRLCVCPWMEQSGFLVLFLFLITTSLDFRKNNIFGILDPKKFVLDEYLHHDKCD